MGAIARRITRVITAVVCVAVSVGVSVATLHVPTREGGGERFNPARYRSDVIVTMFQANWKSVARECGEVLGPEGVGYVHLFLLEYLPQKKNTKREIDLMMKILQNLAQLLKL